VIVKEFTHKSMLMRTSLHSEFMAMRYEKGTDLWSQFDKIRVKYEALMNTGVLVSNENYCLLVINFEPAHISAFLAQLSAGMKVQNIVQLRKYALSSPPENSDPSMDDLDAEELMQLASEEWDRHEIERKSRNKVAAPSDMNGTALVMVASEKPGVKSGGSQGKKKRGKPGECWTCGEKCHMKSSCPKRDEKNSGNSLLNKNHPSNNSNTNTNSVGKAAAQDNGLSE
jgi:hypothetical protein